MSEIGEKSSPYASDLSNGGLKEKREASRDRSGDWVSGGRGSFRSRGSYRGTRGGFRGSYRGRRGGGINMSSRNIDDKAVYLLFEKPINSKTAKDIISFGKDATSVGFGRGCTLHFKTPEEAKEIMAKIKELKFCDLDTNVEYAYKKRVLDSEKTRNLEVEDEEEEEDDEDSDTSPSKKQKAETDEDDVEEKDKEEEEGKGDGGEEEEVDEEALGEGRESGDYAEEGQEEIEEEFEGVEPAEENEDDVDEEYNT